MYTLERENVSPLCILCNLLPQIIPFLKLTLVHTWYEESTPESWPLVHSHEKFTWSFKSLGRMTLCKASDTFFCGLTSISEWPPNIVHIETCKRSCHFLIHSPNCMVSLIFGDLLWREVRMPLNFQPTRMGRHNPWWLHWPSQIVRYYYQELCSAMTI